MTYVLGEAVLSTRVVGVERTDSRNSVAEIRFSVALVPSVASALVRC